MKLEEPFFKQWEYKLRRRSSLFSIDCTWTNTQAASGFPGKLKIHVRFSSKCRDILTQL